MNELPFTITSLKAAYRNGATPSEVVEEVYRRLEAVDDPGIFIHLFAKKQVQAAAQSLPPRSDDYPLWGMPCAIKDNMDIAGVYTTAACPAYAYEAKEDAFVVKRLKDAGALIIGKTNLDQFATGLSGLRTPYAVPKNAVDPMLVPGGSSSGSAVVTSYGIVAFALGTDTAGSVRVPAALNNIAAVKPTLGSISSTGVVPACRTLDTVGVFALTVQDAHKVHQVVTGFDANDAYSRRIRIGPIRPADGEISVGVPDEGSREFFGDDEQAHSFEDTLSLLRQQGAKIRPIDFGPFFDVAHMLYEGAWMAERYTVAEHLLIENPDALLPITAQLIGSARKISASDAFRGMYKLKELSRRVEPVLEVLDLLCVPSIPTFYSVRDLEEDPVGPAAKLGTYTNFVNLLDMCGVTVPVAARRDGKPGSVTLLARAGQDCIIASVGQRLQNSSKHRLGATDWSVS